MTPAKDPYCTPEGIIFDLLNIIPHLKKKATNPITGEPLQQSDLIKLEFHKNEKGEFHCPVTFKQFTEHSHIVAIKETGNVYSYDAYRELNKEPKYYHDLLTDQKFDPKGVITIQDPKSPGLARRLDIKIQHKAKLEAKINTTGTHKRIFEKIKEGEQGSLLEE